jgi:hypothetical protein
MPAHDSTMQHMFTQPRIVASAVTSGTAEARRTAALQAATVLAWTVQSCVSWCWQAYGVHVPLFTRVHALWDCALLQNHTRCGSQAAHRSPCGCGMHM